MSYIDNNIIINIYDNEKMYSSIRYTLLLVNKLNSINDISYVYIIYLDKIKKLNISPEEKFTLFIEYIIYYAKQYKTRTKVFFTTKIVFFLINNYKLVNTENINLLKTKLYTNETIYNNINDDIEWSNQIFYDDLISIIYSKQFWHNYRSIYKLVTKLLIANFFSYSFIRSKMNTYLKFLLSSAEDKAEYRIQSYCNYGLIILYDIENISKLFVFYAYTDRFAWISAVMRATNYFK